VTFTKTTITLVVLSESPIPDSMELESILNECDEGDYVLLDWGARPESLTKDEMAEALYEAGSEPEFFGIQTEADPDRMED
jgi:hypothetical protein